MPLTSVDNFDSNQGTARKKRRGVGGRQHRLWREGGGWGRGLAKKKRREKKMRATSSNVLGLQGSEPTC